MKTIFDTSLPNFWSKKIFEEYKFDTAPEHFDKIAYILFHSIGEILNKAKEETKQPVVMEFKKLNGQFLAAAICEYFANDDESKPGNYSLVCTFDESDIPENAFIITTENTNTHVYFRANAGSKYNLEFSSVGDMLALMNSVFESTYKWLDENAKENTEVGVEVPNIYQARVAIENGCKVFALEPAGEIKMLIKNDASIEK